MEHNEQPVFILSPHLLSHETEQHYLKQISELTIILLLPRSYSLSPGSHLIKQVLASKSKYNFIYIYLPFFNIYINT